MLSLSYDWEETESTLLVRVRLTGVPRRGLDLFGACARAAAASSTLTRRAARGQSATCS